MEKRLVPSGLTPVIMIKAIKRALHGQKLLKDYKGLRKVIKNKSGED